MIKYGWGPENEISIKDLVLKIFVGIHSFEKKKKQRVRFNLDIVLDPNLFSNNNDMDIIVNYETVINNKTGFMFEAGNSEEMSKKII